MKEGWLALITFGVVLGVAVYFFWKPNDGDETREDQILLQEKKPVDALHKSFPVARIVLKEGGMVTLDAWQESAVVVKKEKIIVAVLASWCQMSQLLLKEAGNKVDLILVYEDENEKYLKRGLNGEEPSEELNNASKLIAKLSGQFLAEPQVVTEHLAAEPQIVMGAGVGTVKVNSPAPIYAIKSDQFNEIVDGYPNFVQCTVDACISLSKVVFND